MCGRADSQVCEQVTTRLKLGVMWDHNGTYMEGFGFQYRDQQVLIELDENDDVTGEAPGTSCRDLLPGEALIRSGTPLCFVLTHCVGKWPHADLVMLEPAMGSLRPNSLAALL